MGAASRHTAETFRREWQTCYGDVGSIGHHLRVSGAGRHWVRFYALPFGQRYAETVAERDEILRRAHSLGPEVLKTGAACWLVEWQATPVRRADLVLPDPDNGFDWFGRVRQSTWKEGRFTRLLTHVANDRAGPLLWMNRETGASSLPTTAASTCSRPPLTSATGCAHRTRTGSPIGRTDSSSRCAGFSCPTLRQQNRFARVCHSAHASCLFCAAGD